MIIISPLFARAETIVKNAPISVALKKEFLKNLYPKDIDERIEVQMNELNKRAVGEIALTGISNEIRTRIVREMIVMEQFKKSAEAGLDHVCVPQKPKAEIPRAGCYKAVFNEIASKTPMSSTSIILGLAIVVTQESEAKKAGNYSKEPLCEAVNYFLRMIVKNEPSMYVPPESLAQIMDSGIKAVVKSKLISMMDNLYEKSPELKTTTVYLEYQSVLGRD